MRFPVLRTIRGRILFGFALLILAFGGVSIYTIVNMHRLAREIRVIRTGYQPLAIEAKELVEAQDDLRLYLDEIPNETQAGRVDSRLKRYREMRKKALRAAEKTAGAFADVPRRHRNVVGDIHRWLARFRQTVDQLGPTYQALVAAPPIAGADGEAGQRALTQLKEQEGRLYNDMWRFSKAQESLVSQTALDLESNEAKLRKLAIYLGATAGVLGLLVTVWATFTLRPLRRLRLAAQQIAQGDYGSRIDVEGPTEVADLAGDFNAMSQAVEEREHELVRSERLAAVGKMAAMITHEIRNPLSSIGLNTELLEEEMGALPGDAGDEARALCRAIHTEVDRLTSITEEYLHFARLPKPKLQLEQVNGVVENLVDFEREPLSLRGVELVAELGDDLPPANIDEQQIRQALLNLVRNAADAVSEIGGGRVAVQTARRDDAVEIAVADDGPGIAEDLADKVFDPFFSTKDGGTGLGLALTHQIVREHGGEIRVDSRPGHGTRFVVTLPA